MLEQAAQGQGASTGSGRAGLPCSNRSTGSSSSTSTLSCANSRASEDVVCPTEGLLKTAPAFSADGQRLFFIGARERSGRNRIFAMPATCGAARPVTQDAAFKTNLVADSKGGHLLFLVPAQNAFRKPVGGETPPE